MTNDEIDALAGAHGYRVADVGYEFTGPQFRAAVRQAIQQELDACAKTATAAPVAYYNSSWTLTPQAYAEARKRDPDRFSDMRPAYAAAPTPRP